MKDSIRREVPEHLRSLRGDYISGHTCGRHKEAAGNQMLARLNFICETLGTERKLKERILNILEKAAGDGHDQANLSSQAARKKIVREILEEFEDLTHPDLDLLQKEQKGQST